MLKYVLKKQLDSSITDRENFNIFNNLKNKFTNIVFEYVSIDSTTSYYLKNYIYNKCKINSLFANKRIVTKLKNIDNLGNLKEVPYLLDNSDNYFIYKNCIFKNENRRTSNVSLKFIRGTLDIDSLLKDAFNYTYSIKDENVNTEPYFYNFYIKEHFGTASENNMFNINMNNQNTPNTGDTISSDKSDDDFDYMIFDNDTPLLYDSSRIFEYKEIRVNPFDNYYFPQKIIDYVTSISQWLNNDKWFTERQLPYKRGILLHGPAGTGKSSFAKVLGIKFGIPIHQFHLANMTDKDFKTSWEEAVQNTRVIILIEDFDNIYNKRTPISSKTKLSFDTILNTISGIQDMSGVILVITTNDISKIDEAIGVSNEVGISTRPGRIDDVIYLGHMEDKEKEKLATKILKDWPNLIIDVMNNTNRYTAAQVQEYSIKLALNELKKSNTII